jgi:glutamine synthetase
MSWLDDHPEIRNLRCGAADLNGQPRGKRMPRRFAKSWKRMARAFRFRC